MIPIPKLPAWTNAPWFNSVTYLSVLAVAVLEASGQEWAPAWVRILTAFLVVSGAIVKPRT
mgnify:CR=1 FL=1